MSDDVEILRSRRVEVPTWVIQQAWEHIQESGDRHATLLFVGLEEAQHISCVGVSTRRVPIGKRLAEPGPATQESAIEAPSSIWSMDTLTDDVVLTIVNQHGPINTKTVGDMLGIPGNVINLRQKIRRILERLVKQRQLRQSGSGHSQTFSKREQARMSVRPASRRKIGRGDITAESVMELMTQAAIPISSRTISDMFQIPRSNNTIRSKTTQILRELIAGGQVRLAGSGEGGRLYELTGENLARKAE